MDDATQPLVESLALLDKSPVNRDERGRLLPGQKSLNPNGRPRKNWTMAELTEQALEEADETGIPFNKLIAIKLRTLALRGDMQAIKEIYDRMDGKAKESLEHSGAVEIYTHRAPIDEI